jgi:hypothetical protein
MDEGSVETLEMEDTMKDGHRFSIIRSRKAKRAACPMNQAVVKQEISPASWSSTRILVDDDRAVGNKNCVMGIRQWVRKRVWECNGRECESVDARFEPVTERESRLRLRKFAQ